MRWLKIAIGIFILLVFTGGLGLYFFGGYKDYLKARSQTETLLGDERVTAEAFWHPDYPNIYRGTLGLVSEIGQGGVLLWTIQGPRYFVADEYTLYWYYNGCREQILAATPETGTLTIEKERYPNLVEWKKQVKPGDWVAIVTAQDANVGNIREVHAHNWWQFVPGDMEAKCAR